MAGAANRAAATTGISRCPRRSPLLFPTPMIFTSVRLRIVLAGISAIFASAFISPAQTNYYYPSGQEYAAVGSLPGDQVFPDAAISGSGGFVVWQDNVTDGDGWGISARRLDSTLSGTLGTFRVNASGAGDQENPRVALLKNGGAAFVWQGGQLGKQHILARFLAPNNTFITTNDIQVNTQSSNTFELVYNYTTNTTSTITTNLSHGRIVSYTTNTSTTVTTTVTTNTIVTGLQVNPAMAVLNNSNVVVVWGSFNQAGSRSLQDVYGQILSPTGEKIGGEFLVNQFTSFNQRTPSVAALSGGGFVVTWISEQQRQTSGGTIDQTNGTVSSQVGSPSVDVYARQFNASGVPAGAEFWVNTDNNPCVSPAVAASDAGFLIVWAASDLANTDNSLDIHGRIFSNAGAGGTPFYINSHTYGDQYLPRISSIGSDYLVTWTSLGQDSSREGIYGQFVHDNGSLTGGEFLVNTTTLGQQMHPAVASDGATEFLVVWTSFSGYPNTFDLYAQRYLNSAEALQMMSTPFVWAPFVTSSNVYQPQLVVTWAPVQGLPVSGYEVFVDGSASAVATVASNQWTMTAANGLAAGSTHSFKVDYVLTDGRHSPKSLSASGTTWQNSLNWGGIPFEWMAQYYGSDFSTWPSASSRPAGTGMTLAQIFLSGGNPLDSSTWLQTALTKTAQGLFLTWNTQAGAMYQVQSSTNFQEWSNLGAPRFAAGTSDSIFVGGSPVGYYRVLLLR
mgnify:CR=1 FL=1